MKEEELIAAFEKDLDAAIKENKPLCLDETPSFFRLPLKMQRRIREIASFSERLYDIEHSPKLILDIDNAGSKQ